jgi:hypothetical protein
MNYILNDEELIKKTALNYIEGWYEGNQERMQEALHPKLVKRRFVSKDEIWQLDAPAMIKLTAEGPGKLAEPEKGRKEVTILDVKENIASVKVDSNKFTDYLLMIKENNQWKIVDALWDYHK